MQSLEDGDLRITCDTSIEGQIIFNWFGKSNARSPSVILLPYFRDAIEQAASQSQRLIMHFERMEYFNSSTITAIVQLIRLSRTQNVHMHLFYNKSLQWQRASFEALGVLADDDSSLEIQGITPEEKDYAASHV